MSVAEWACYVAALPALQAEAALRQAEVLTLPWQRPADQRRTLHRLQRAAGGSIEPTGPSPPTPIDGMPIHHT